MWKNYWQKTCVKHNRWSILQFNSFVYYLNNTTVEVFIEQDKPMRYITAYVGNLQCPNSRKISIQTRNFYFKLKKR